MVLDVAFLDRIAVGFFALDLSQAEILKTAILDGIAIGSFPLGGGETIILPIPVLDGIAVRRVCGIGRRCERGGRYKKANFEP